MPLNRAGVGAGLCESGMRRSRMQRLRDRAEEELGAAHRLGLAERLSAHRIGLAESGTLRTESDPQNLVRAQLKGDRALADDAARERDLADQKFRRPANAAPPGP